MGWYNLGSALLVSAFILPGSAAFAAGKPQLVTVPMATVGMSASEGLEAWKIVKEAIAQSKGRLGVTVSLQKRRHDFVVGPAREQVKDCTGNIDCLKEIGSALGADILVTGRVTPKLVSLIALEVNTGRLVGEAETPIELQKAALDSRASSAARLLVAAMAPDDSGPSAGPSSAVPSGGPSSAAPTGGPMAMRPGPGPQASGGDEGLKGFDGPDDGLKSDEPAPTSMAPPAEEAPINPMHGVLKLSLDQLRSVIRVSIDGTDIAFTPQGSVHWRGVPGDHKLVVEKSSGERLSRNVFVEPGSETNVVLQWPNLAGSGPPPAQSDDQGSAVTGTWWFWTSLGAAVAAGTTTAVLLAGGDKGGPALAGETGRIQGTY